jgi:adenosylcobinamide-GDP ribazoletransferase
VAREPIVSARDRAAVALGQDGLVRAAAAATPFRDLAAAFAFLTRLPVPARWLAGDRTGAAAFGLAGAAIGGVAAIPVVLVGQAHPGPAAVASVAIIAILTGALHLDGLADTADALAAPAGAADRARTDPRAGSAGVVAVVIVLLLDAAVLTELASAGGLIAAAALVTAGAASRAAATIAGVLAGPTRSGGRLGTWFVSRLRPADAWLAMATTVGIGGLASALAGPPLAAGLIGGSALAAAAGAVIVRLRRRLDGDGFGALVELTFTAVLVAVLAARSVPG